MIKAKSAVEIKADNARWDALLATDESQVLLEKLADKALAEHQAGKTQPMTFDNDMRDYHINIFYSEKDDGYIADIPDLQACSAFGETPEEALQQVNVAKTAWIEAARAEGKAIPKPMYRPVIYQVAPSLATA